MKIRIVVDDQLVSVDGSVLKMPELDWGKFDGDPSSPWDDIAAVQFDSAKGQGHVEYREVTTSQATRHNMRPPDWNIRQSEFDEMFGWVLPIHTARKAEMEAERARIEVEEEAARKEAEAAAQAAVKARIDAHNAALLKGEPAESSDAKDAVIAQMQAKLAALEGKVGVFEDAVKEVSGGGT